MTKQHRNSQKRIYLQDTSYFVTSKTYDNFPFFQERIFCELFMENLKLCKELYDFWLFGFVLIYDHCHLLMLPKGERDISKIMFSVKKQFSHNCNVVMGYNRLWNLTTEGEQSIVRLRDGYVKRSHNQINNYRIHNKWFQSNIHHNPQKLTHKLHIFDKFTLTSQTRFQIKHPQNPFPKFHWQKSFRDHYIRNDNDFDNHMEYIAGNPYKHGLLNNGPYVFTNDEYGDLIDNP